MLKEGQFLNEAKMMKWLVAHGFLGARNLPMQKLIEFVDEKHWRWFPVGEYNFKFTHQDGCFVVTEVTRVRRGWLAQQSRDPGGCDALWLKCNHPDINPA